MRVGERSSGFAFVAVLVLLAICMLGLSMAGPMWSQQARREREQELLRIGGLYAQALASYRDHASGTLKQYPTTLQDLLADSRYVGTIRHLRKLYPDPVNPGQPWGLMTDLDHHITGVYSLSNEAPLSGAAIDLGGVKLPAATRYSDWKFSPQQPS